MTRLPIELPPELAGQTLTAFVGCVVSYPEGRGRCLRFRHGVVVRGSTGLDAATLAAGLAAGGLSLQGAASVTMALPDSLKPVTPGRPPAQATTTIEWTPGAAPSLPTPAARSLRPTEE